MKALMGKGTVENLQYEVFTPLLKVLLLWMLPSGRRRNEQATVTVGPTNKVLDVTAPVPWSVVGPSTKLGPTNLGCKGNHCNAWQA